MKTQLTELVFILDRSGSMGGLEDDTINGFNAMLADQQNGRGQALVTTVLFDDRYELLHDRANIQHIRPITRQNYFVRGGTALLDAIGKTIKKTERIHRYGLMAYRPSKTLFVITTDGMENASRFYSYETVKAMIEYQQSAFGWEFLFLGANIDAIHTARRMGIHADRAANYFADKEGVFLKDEIVNKTITGFREEGHFDKNWKASLEEEELKRKGLAG